jgi:hypothetical protein
MQTVRAVEDGELHDLAGRREEVLHRRQRRVAQPAVARHPLPQLEQPQPGPQRAAGVALDPAPRRQLGGEPRDRRAGQPGAPRDLAHADRLARGGDRVEHGERPPHRRVPLRGTHRAECGTRRARSEPC